MQEKQKREAFGASVLVFFLALVLCAPGCITKAEYKADVKARRSYFDATRDDLAVQYDTLPEPSRSTRLNTIRVEDKSIQAAEVRAGLREPPPEDDKAAAPGGQ